MYPSKSSRYYGIFVKEQIDYLATYYNVEPTIYFINARQEGRLAYLKSILDIRKIFHQKPFDVIHIHYGIAGLFALFGDLPCKTFLTLHGADILPNQGMYIQNFLSRWIVRKVDKVFILNQEMKEILTKCKVDYELLPCGINTDFFYPRASIRSSTAKKIIFPADPTIAIKNYPLFRQVLGVLEKEYKLTVDMGSIHDMTREEVRDMLSNGDCLLMTSHSEGSPQIVKEALATDLPVVSVDVGDVYEMLKNVPNCYVSESRDAYELASLVFKSLQGNRQGIRDAFLAKGKYDNQSICRKLWQQYAA